LTSPEPAAPRGTIYDLGYQGYDGPRLGRRYAVWSLYVLSVRNAFGLGRGLLPKVLAFGLLALAFVPAVVQLILAAVLPTDEFEFVQPHEYYGFIQIIIILFVAALASDLVGNDRRSRTLALYFSRPIERNDYAIAKLAALSSSLLAITVLPQAVMFAGNWLGATDGGAWGRDHAGDALPIVLSGVLVCLLFASVGLLIATFAERRRFATVSILAIFLITFATVSIIVEVVDADAARYAVFLSPVHVMRGFTLVLFDAVPPLPFGQPEGVDEQIAFVDLPGAVYIAAALAYVAVCTFFILRRYRGTV
jgi:ABC-2 type transport system permease protein